MGEAAAVAGDLRAGLQELRAGRPAEAYERLARVVGDREFTDGPELADVAARAFGLAAQAALQHGRFADAEAWAAESLRRARLLGDAEGIADVTALLATVRDRRARPDGATDEARERLRGASLAELLAIRDPAARTEALLRKCQTSLHDDDRGTVLAAAELAWREAAGRGDVRAQVLARLCAAHAQPDAAEQHLAAATAALEAGGPETHALVTAVARASALLGVAVAHEPFAGRATG